MTKSSDSGDVTKAVGDGDMIISSSNSGKSFVLSYAEAVDGKKRKKGVDGDWTATPSHTHHPRDGVFHRVTNTKKRKMTGTRKVKTNTQPTISSFLSNETTFKTNSLGGGFFRYSIGGSSRNFYKPLEDKNDDDNNDDVIMYDDDEGTTEKAIPGPSKKKMKKETKMTKQPSLSMSKNKKNKKQSVIIDDDDIIINNNNNDQPKMDSNIIDLTKDSPNGATTGKKKVSKKKTKNDDEVGSSLSSSSSSSSLVTKKDATEKKTKKSPPKQVSSSSSSLSSSSSSLVTMKKKKKKKRSTPKKKSALKSSSSSLSSSSSSSSLSEEDLAYLSSIHLICDEMLGEGNCLFRTFSHQQYRDFGERHADYRLAIMNHIEERCGEYEAFYAPEDNQQLTWEQYIAAMKIPASSAVEKHLYGGHLEINAAADLYDCEIIVHQKKGEYWTTTSIGNSDGTAINGTWNILFTGNHYDSLRYDFEQLPSGSTPSESGSVSSTDDEIASNDDENDREEFNSSMVGDDDDDQDPLDMADDMADKVGIGIISPEDIAMIEETYE